MNEPHLVYDRVGQNRRRTWILITFSFVVLVLSVPAVGYLVSRLVTAAAAALADILERGYGARIMLAYQLHILRFVAVTTTGVAALLAILFWAIASSPGARLLVLAGARPAMAGESHVQHILDSLAIGAGLPSPKLYFSESSAPNAFAVGTGPDHAAVVVTTGALRLLDRRELEGVLAHELSHIGNHDILLNTVVASIGLFLRFLGPATFFIGPVLSAMIRASVSREREFLADADAALLTRFPQGLLRALAKIGSAGSPIPGSNPAFSHFYFAEATTSAGPWFQTMLLATHPPIGERIRRLMEFQGVDSLVPLREAIRCGREYKETHPHSTADPTPADIAQTEFASLCMGNPLGRVYEVTAEEPVAVYYSPDLRSEVLGHLQPGKLVVAFDDPGPFRQVTMPDWTFGYIPGSVGLLLMPEMIPAEVYDERSRAAAEAALPPVDMRPRHPSSSQRQRLV